MNNDLNTRKGGNHQQLILDGGVGEQHEIEIGDHNQIAMGGHSDLREVLINISLIGDHCDIGNSAPAGGVGICGGFTDI